MSKISKETREALYLKYGGKCAYCGQYLPNRWHVDHIVPILRKTTDWLAGDCTKSNLNPACPSCNISKGRMALEDWRDWIKNHVRSLNRYNKPYRLAKAYGLIVETHLPVVFYFETFEAGMQHEDANNNAR